MLRPGTDAPWRALVLRGNTYPHPMTDPQRHDWQAIIADLERAGLKLHTIAKMCRREWTQVNRWKHGSEPRHYEGEMLLLIHAEYVSHGTTVVSDDDCQHLSNT